MLTFLTWAAGVYAAIWAAAAVFFYCINRAYCAEAVSRSRDRWTAAFLGLIWPAVLVQLVRLAWQGFRDRD